MKLTEQIKSTARCALAFRRYQLMNYWLECFQVGDKENMEFWSQRIQELNDAHAALLG